MKTLSFIFAQLLISTNLFAMESMTQTFITTSIGKIAVYEKNSALTDKTTVIFLHGLYFDHHLWDDQMDQITDRRVISVDMPMHGESTEVISNWNLTDCANMLIELMDSLKLEKVCAFGHSWGSMTILRAMSNHPERFENAGLFNMPYQSYSRKEIRKIRFQHSALIFKRTYIKQAAKTLFSAASLKSNPELVDELSRTMFHLSNRTIKYLDKVVRIETTDQSSTIDQITAPFTIVMGTEDYIVPQKNIKNGILVEAGHTIPLEKPEKTSEIIQSILYSK